MSLLNACVEHYSGCSGILDVQLKDEENVNHHLFNVIIFVMPGNTRDMGRDTHIYQHVHPHTSVS